MSHDVGGCDTISCLLNELRHPSSRYYVSNVVHQSYLLARATAR
jgi:hypothetical protein